MRIMMHLPSWRHIISSDVISEGDTFGRCSKLMCNYSVHLWMMLSTWSSMVDTVWSQPSNSYTKKSWLWVVKRWSCCEIMIFLLDSMSSATEFNLDLMDMGSGWKWWQAALKNLCLNSWMGSWGQLWDHDLPRMQGWSTNLGRWDARKRSNPGRVHQGSREESTAVVDGSIYHQTKPNQSCKSYLQ